MIVLTFTPKSPKMPVIHGILIQRQGMMVEVAWDDVPSRPATTGWINITKQIGQVTMKSMTSFRWIETGVRLIASGDIAGGRQVLKVKEDLRRAERLRKENAV